MDSTDIAALRRREIAALPTAPLGGSHRAVVLDDGLPETHLVLWALRTRGWSASSRPAHPKAVMDLMAEPLALVVVTDRHLAGGDTVARLVEALRDGPGRPLVSTLSSTAGPLTSRPAPARYGWLRRLGPRRSTERR